MALTTFAELKSSIADFLNRDDLTSVIPDFITLAEADMSRKLRHWRMEKRSTAVLDTQYTQLPDDFYEPIRMAITSGDTYTLELSNLQNLADQRQRTANTSGRPQLYAITDGSINVWPAPDSSYTVEMIYYSKIIPLSDSNTSNWILQYYPDAYLYGALVHSAPYLAEDARAAVWAGLFQNAIDGINIDSDKSKYGGSGRRMKIRSY